MVKHNFYEKVGGKCPRPPFSTPLLLQNPFTIVQFLWIFEKNLQEIYEEGAVKLLCLLFSEGLVARKRSLGPFPFRVTTVFCIKC